MRKILILILMLVGTTVYAEKIDVIKHSRAGGLIDRMNEVIASSLGDRFGKFINVGNCIQAKQILEKTNTPVLTAWPTEREASGSPCNINNDLLISTFSNSPYHITYLEGNEQSADINFLKTSESVIVGVWDSNFWAPAQTEFLRAINPSIKVVRYKSKPFRTALTSGEIDYKLVSFPGNDPVLAIMDGKSLLPEHKFSNMGYSMMFAGNIPYDVEKVYSGHAWRNRIDTTHEPWLQNLSRTDKLTLVEQMLADIANTR
jgi:hypothetical protein